MSNKGGRKREVSIYDDFNPNKKYIACTSCLEEPDAVTYYRGKAEIDNAAIPIEIVLADYYEKDLAVDFTIHVSPIINQLPIPALAVSQVVDRRFKIFASLPCTVHYIVFGKRRDFTKKEDEEEEDEEEELEKKGKKTIIIKGNTPFRYFTFLEKAPKI